MDIILIISIPPFFLLSPHYCLTLLFVSTSVLSTFMFLFGADFVQVVIVDFYSEKGIYIKKEHIKFTQHS